jgi:hypothetical protein
MDDILGTQNNFKSLSIKDLLEARDLYHYHLLNKKNVVGTAIGLYLIRHTDPSPKQESLLITRERTQDVLQRRSGQNARYAAESSTEHPASRRARGAQPKEERTFVNSGVRDYSWPCVLALVNDWVRDTDFGMKKGELHPEELVPRTLYLPDGRMVPVCVVKVEQAGPADELLPDWHWPASRYSPGMPIVVETQGHQHRATAGCLVSDGHTAYVLTSRHVCGASGEPVYTIADNRTVEIGRASARHLTRLTFAEIYPEYPSPRTAVNLDVGLVELNDVNDWTSGTLGFGKTGALADLNAMNITLRLIDAPVVAAGAASGRLEGRIKALFYRYKSVGGYDYVSDFLIAPRDLEEEEKEQMKLLGKVAAAPRRDSRLPTHTQPGDSGAVWHLVEPPETTARTKKKPQGAAADAFSGELRPLAIEWGGQVFAEHGSESRFAFALATSMTTVCRWLDVELVLDRDNGPRPYWGQTGHYSIASFAGEALPNGSLRTFIDRNLDRISFSITGLSPGNISERLKQAKTDAGLVPLADVPDMVWKAYPSKTKGGRDTQFAGKGRTTGPEHPTHYADIDEPRPSDGKTLRDLCIADETNVNVGFWQTFYDDCDKKESRSRGLLPFRVWQFFDAMSDFARQGDAASFLCAAGLVSHYVGDACQPLHGSMYSDGYDDRPTKIVHHNRGTGKAYEEPSHVGAGVHSTYETKMIDRYSEDIVAGLSNAVTAGISSKHSITSGREAAVAIVQLMQRTAKTIPPIDLVNEFIAAGSKSTVAAQDALWKRFGKDTVKVMADGASVLAAVWVGAWNAGNGDAIPAGQRTEIKPATLVDLYCDPSFVPSLDLDQIGKVLLGEASAPSAAKKTGRRRPVARRKKRRSVKA